MCDSDINRRAFTTASIAAGAVIGAAWSADAQAQGVKESDVTIKTPDGETDAALYVPPGKGPFPGILIFTDIFGLRPAFRDMGKRLASSGYVVLVPNPFYRTKKGPLLTTEEQASFNFAKDIAKINPHVGPANAGAATDETAWLAYLDGLPQVSKKAKLGVTGYCMGGPRVVQASALRPDRVGAAMACHPGNGLVTKNPDSPHLLAPKIKAKTFFAIAQNDAAQWAMQHPAPEPGIAEQLKAAYQAAGNPCGAEVYKAAHGWCLNDGAAWNKDEAERAFTQMLALFKEGTAA